MDKSSGIKIHLIRLDTPGRVECGAYLAQCAGSSSISLITCEDCLCKLRSIYENVCNKKNPRYEPPDDID